MIVNENIPLSVISALRAQGHDVLSVKEQLKGAKDEAILAVGVREGRVVVTQDKDFGELCFRAGLPATCGVVLFRLSGTKPEEDISRILNVLNGDIEFSGHFCVVDKDTIRLRELPK
jgi:predicted nuclease of predicted toxin-antitoxin system